MVAADRAGAIGRLHRQMVTGAPSVYEAAASFLGFLDESQECLTKVIAAYLLAWRKETMYGKDTDWIFASSRTKGKTPRVGNMQVRSYLYPAAVKAGFLTTTNIKVMRTIKKKGKKVKAEVEVPIYFDKTGKRVRRFGFHQFRHSLSSFLTTKKKVDPKTVQTALRQSDVAFTLNQYTQTDNDELLAAQNLILDAIFKTEPRAVQ